ncbi:hypothetical protein [Zobellia laminariae]|uniref:hypothetical protein n=1 Tax=Zobellia laminariae TaxID=248906 RepID=UPI0026F4634D|nr:hypothetical protein [Zobellia laminariae]WKX77198.1 hypothetical protein Q5W13_03500 [Zobellia laminariae]
MKNVPLVVLLFLTQLAFSQVKIGDNINQIDAASLMELESSTKVFVVTRVTNAQMNSITPLNGALVFNTDQNCLFQYKGNIWSSLCVNIAAGETITALLDNNDGTVTYTNEAGISAIISKANLVDNLDGSYTFSNGTSAINFVGTDNQNLENANLDATTSILNIDIENGNSTTADLSALEESADITAVQDDVDANEADADAALLAEISRATAAETNLQADIDTNEADADAAILAETTRATAAETTIQNDVNQNEADADAAIALKENAANKSTDVTLADATDTKFPTELAVKTYVDGQIAATADDDITAATIDAASVLKIDEGATSITVDLSDLEESADIIAVQNDVDTNEADADAAILAVQNDVDTNEADADAAILAETTRATAAETAIQNDVNQNEADADAAIALKEDAANKSTDVTLADPTDTKFPTELAVKTYVDGQIAATADDDITAATIDAASVLKIDEGTTSVTVDLSALEESADITAVQDDVDQNEADADASILAETNRATAAETAIQNDVDQNEADADAAILAETTRATAAETAIQNDVNQNEADADAAIVLKEDAANKSTDVTLADPTDTKFPTELAVKTYVDAQIAATADDDITAATIDAASVLKIDEGATSVTVDLSALEESADITAVQNDVDQNEADADAAILAETNRAKAAETAIQNDVDQNETDADAAILAETNRATAAETAIQNDVNQNEADADAAIALKEDAANKSTDITLADATDTKFPTELAVKTYVDGQIAATADDDITAATIDAASLLKIDEGSTSVTVDLSDLEESADITAVQNDVDANEADTDAAILAETNRATAAETAIQNDVDQNEADADAAILAETTRATAAETAIQNDVNQNEADADAAIALKEDAANKSTDITLADPTDTKFPTELAVKTYVDAQIAATADDDITAATIDAASVLKIDEGATSVTVDLSDLEESADITAVQNDVDANEADADAAILAETNRATAAETAIQNDINQNEADADAAILAETNRATAAETAIQNDVNQNEADADAAIALKEDAANKSTDITLADATNTKFPTELAVKTYVDGQITLYADDDITAASINASSVLKIDEGATSVTVDLSDLEESADIIAVQDDVDQNEADADAAIALKEDAVNKSTDVTLADATDTKFPTELAVKTYVDGQITATADDDITAATIDAASVLKIDEGATSVTVDLSALEESADITAVQNDVDTNEADADAAILAETNRATAAETAIQNDIDANEADADAAIALKEDAANKSTDVTLADATDTKFPTELAVKTYVDGQIAATADDDITAATIDAASLLKIDEGATSVTVDLSDLEESADITAETNRATAAETAIQNDVDQNEADADAAILAETTRATAAETTIQNDVNQNEADADAAIALKEDAANKSTDVTLADATDTKFPTELAVKTYVDGQITATADDDITAATIDAASVLKIDEGATSVTVDLSALEESADITAETNRATAAETAIQNDVDQNEADADAAILAETNRATAAETAIQNDVNQNEADADAAIALKEDSANKSTDITLADPTDTKFPTELAVKTYVDAQIAATADDDITAVTIDAASVLKIDEGATSVTVDLSDLEESADITAVQNDVDANEADADAAILAETNRATTAETAIQNDINQNEADADAAILAETNRATAAETAIQNDVNQNEADADAAIALKEDAANKSTDITLADATNTKFPTELAVKTYVDGQITLNADDDITAASINASSVLKIDEGATSVTVDLSDLEESADIITVQDDVDQNEADADAAIALKEDAVNKSTDVTLADVTDTKFPTELAVKTYVDGQITATADDDITGVTINTSSILTISEGGTSVTANLSALEESADITAVQNDVNQNEADADAAILAEQLRATTAETTLQNNINLKEDANNKSTDVNLADASNTKFPTELAVKTYVDSQVGSVNSLANGNIFVGDNSNIAQGVAMSGDATLSNTGALTIETDAVTAAKINSDVAGNGLSQNATTGALEVDALNISDLVTGNKIATITQPDASTVAINETITSFAEVSGNRSILRFTNEANGTDDVTSVVRSVNGVVPAANGNVAVILSSTSTGLEVNLPSTGVDSDIYIVSGESGLTADRNGVAFIYDDVTGWQEVTTDLSTNDARYLNVNGDAMAGTLSMASHPLTNLLDPSNAQDAATKNYVDGLATGDITSTDLTVTNGTDSAFKDVTLTIANGAVTPLKIAAGANNQSLVTDNTGTVSWIDSSTFNHFGTTGSVFFAGPTGTPIEDNDQLFWDSANNRLGIGTNTPTHKLQVTGQVRATSFANADGTANSPSYRFNSDGDTGMYKEGTNELGFSTNATNAILIDASQNVGIGTVTPDESLHVANNMRLDGSFEDKDGEAGTAGQVLSSTATGTDWIDAPSADPKISTDAGNSVTAGTDAGVFYNSPIKAFGKISSAGTVIKSTPGVTVTKLAGLGHYQVTLAAGTTADSDYIIQLSQP